MAKSDYDAIQRRIASLQVQARALKEKEKAGVVARIKEAIEAYEISPRELFGKGPARKAGLANGRAAKFADGNGNSWGGRGPRPQWLREALAAGSNLEDFLTVATAAPAKTNGTGKKGAAHSAGAAAGGAKIRRKPKGRVPVKFKDEAGNSWSGRGSQPRWLREALASGKNLEQFAV